MKFALIGVGGYIAESHLKAIKETENDLIVACDSCDSVGILDRYFKDCTFFSYSSMFYDFCRDHRVDFIVICLPNHLHNNHIRNSLAVSPFTRVIVEKPLVINPSDLVVLQPYDDRIYSIMQLRHHPYISVLKDCYKENSFLDVRVEYFTPRGDWFNKSWKGDSKKSGGISLNIGIHIIDFLETVFGPLNLRSVKSFSVGRTIVFESDHSLISLKISTDVSFPARRSVYVSNPSTGYFEVFDLNSVDFTGMHTVCYRDILSGSGVPPSSVYRSLNLAFEIEQNV